MAGRRLAFSLLAVALAASGATLVAQRPAKRVFVRVFDRSGAAIVDLRQDEIEIEEDGAPRQVTRVARTDGPMRILLVVDTSTNMAPLLTHFRAGLAAFLDAIPDDHEIALLGAGGQLHVLVPPTPERGRLREAVAAFGPNGGSAALLDSLLESHRRFFERAPDRWPVFVIVAIDDGESRRENHVDLYNSFVVDFMARGGSAHAVVLHGSNNGIATDIAMNITENTGGSYTPIAAVTALPDALRAVAERIGEDHRRMADSYEVDYRGGSSPTPEVGVSVRRAGATVLISPRRPF